ncbi:MAG: T9SS type A sorting domain-containing protein, partial [Bacteroidetes bacterium]|nr:T9SS type A sorting domain-containing protein [Bacteroidota bacterium]
AEGLAPVAVINRFRLYPNPTAGTFTLEQSGDGTGQDLKLEIYSMMGERIMSESILGEKKHQFVLGNVPAGIYLVRIMDGEKAETVKLIKQ